ncbi:type II and III secretion system protein [bacterium]|nr:type II and III secretion system protein [Candidatus Omnitrophota bacterium]MBU2528503.1 type II and III secretion system protein [bacterium]MBU3929903.1 type II and III secretion system protein [bacterium]MBU4122426.1 type II and III secretion system protein [bacterium]
MIKKILILLIMGAALSPARAEVAKCLNDESNADELTMLEIANKKPAKLLEIAIEAVEITNNKAREMGIKWVDGISMGEISYVNDARVPAVMPELPSLFRVGEFARLGAITGDLKLMMTKGAARLLANPKMITKSGTNARFMVGGEMPYIVITADGPNVEWKDYGIKMNIVPTVIDDKDQKIGLSVFTEVSDLDWENAAIYGNTKVPAIITRNASSTLQMRSGETVAVAKLLRTFKQDTSQGIPLLGEIPVLKYLFGSHGTVDNRTTVVIFVTPKIMDEGMKIEEVPY